MIRPPPNSSLFPYPTLFRSASRQDPGEREDRRVRSPRVLRQVSDLAGAQHLATGRQPLTREDPGQRGLARAVAADEPDLVAGGDPERDTLHEQPGAGADLEVVDGEHSGTEPRARGNGGGSGSLHGPGGRWQADGPV